MPKQLHILFVHGVGVQQRLSSLLKPYQSIRFDTTIAEPGNSSGDLLSNYELSEFNDIDSPTRLVLRRKSRTDTTYPEKIFLYEVNYSHLGGVLRENHPFSITQLTVSLNLTIDIAQRRLEENKPRGFVVGPRRSVHLALALEAKGLADVLVASTLPFLYLLPILRKVLPIPELVQRYRRFFEDVATFALDESSFNVVSAHFTKTVEAIRHEMPKEDDAEFIMVAHSLGSVVAHNYLVSKWEKKNSDPPPLNKLITFGSPIGLLCWLWVFLDFDRMNFLRKAEALSAPFFSWEPVLPPLSNPAGSRRLRKISLHPISWINVVNRLDPIATAFSQDYAYMGITSRSRKGGLIGGVVDHRYVQGRGFSVHTGYYKDRPIWVKGPAGQNETLLEILLCSLGVGGWNLRNPSPARSDEHWSSVMAWQAWLRWMFHAIGGGLLGLFLTIICWPIKVPFISDRHLTPLLVILLWPPMVVWATATVQKVIWGGPTKWTMRIPEGSIRRWLPRMSPYRIRRLFLQFVPFAPGKRNRWTPYLQWLLSMICVLVGPILVANYVWVAVFHGPFVRWPGLKTAVLGLLLFSLYLASFIASEFFRRWRKVVRVVSFAPKKRCRLWCSLRDTTLANIIRRACRD